MLTLLRDLIQHKWSANAGLLKAVAQHKPSNEDDELRRLLHHILIANRFWLALSMESAFDEKKESTVPQTLDALTAGYRETCGRELDWISNIEETNLARRLETPYIPGISFSVAEAVMQVCMHSHGHRAQGATRLRLLGGTPPAMDFILWLKERPAPCWD